MSAQSLRGPLADDPQTSGLASPPSAVPEFREWTLLLLGQAGPCSLPPAAPFILTQRRR